MKAPNVNVKDILKKLSFLKNNLALLVPILIAVVAVLLFVPTTLLSGRLRATIEKQSVQPSKQIDSMVKKVDEAAEAEALEAYINAYAQDANAMDNLMVQTTQREMLSYKVFDINQTSPLLYDPFRQGYVSGVEAMLQRLRAGAPPSDAEINAALESSARSMFGRNRPAGGSGYGASGGQYGQRRNFRMMTEMDRKIVDKVCEDKAKTAKVYANPVDLGGYAYWSDWKFENQDKAVRDCWYWQMACWMLEDVVATTQSMNEGSDNVLNSPVKRIMNVQFTQSRMGRSALGRGRRTAAVPRDKQTPTYVTKVQNAMTGTPCTGRFCNEQIDVMQFEVRVIVRATDWMRLMQELCSAKTHTYRGLFGDQPEQTFKHNQITILETSITPVDREDFDHSGFQYGEDEVVDVDLICEYIFNIKAYDAIMPQLVKNDITGVSEAAQK